MGGLGTLLSYPSSKTDESIGFVAFESVEVVTTSRPGAFPDRPTVAKAGNEKGDGEKAGHLRDGATIKEKCPKCEAPEMVFHTAQLRSADEGQTIFYSCVKCGYVLLTFGRQPLLSKSSASVKPSSLVDLDISIE
ncbi:DNA-directed RNA polymerase I core subunit rpa12 [Borealophlyctis nickersoniae]|nr:DNA-directed RNA polymerase I core subunit rpa12 [Borealophlyctis nickersoniae]